MKYLRLSLVLVLSACQSVPSQGQILLDQTTVDTTTLVSGIDIPWEIIWGPDNHIWMTERYGRISRINPVNGQRQTLITLTDVRATGESGLLGMVLHPHFADTPWVFAAYTYTLGNGIYERIVRFDYQVLTHTLTRADTLLEAIPGNSTHNGCRMLITPDGKLLFSTGDAQDQSSPQNRASVNGKVLRLNLDGSIPDDNPDPGSPLWSLGHRNVQGLLQHPNGHIYLSEHGPNSDDELSILYKNRNYGWPNVLGPCDAQNELFFCSTNQVVEPIAWWSPTIAPSDLIWYDHPAIPEFRNRLLLTTLKNKRLYSFELSPSGDSVLSEREWLNGVFGRIRDICTDPDGHIYLATNGENWSNDAPFTHSIVKISNPNYNPTGTAALEKDILARLLGNPLDSSSQLEVGEYWLGGRLLVRDMLGRPVYEARIENRMTALGQLKLAAGQYLIELNKGGQSTQLRLVAR